MRARIERRDPSRRAPERPDCFYNLFSLQKKPDLYCAVPDDRPVPRFIASPEWEFRGTTDESALGPVRSRAAASGVRLNGFFLFFSPEHLGRARAFRAGRQSYASDCDRLPDPFLSGTRRPFVHKAPTPASAGPLPGQSLRSDATARDEVSAFGCPAFASRKMSVSPGA